VSSALLVMSISSLGWAAFDVLRKRLAADVPALPLVTVLALGLTPLFAVWLLVTGWPSVSAGYASRAMLAVTGNVAANIMFVHAVRVAPLSTTVPLLSFTPVFTALLSAALLREVPAVRPAFGIVLVVLGALTLQWGAALAGQRRLPVFGPGPRLMLGVALLWSLVAVADKAAIARASAALHGLVQTGGVGLVLLALLATRRELGALAGLRCHGRGLAAAAVASGLALGLQFVAYGLVFVSTVEAVKRTLGMLAAVINGRVFFGEPLTPAKWAGVTLLALGVLLVLRG
jgi:drug/metabolite transporter (DMT)-like permease